MLVLVVFISRVRITRRIFADPSWGLFQADSGRGQKPVEVVKEEGTRRRPRVGCACLFPLCIGLLFAWLFIVSRDVLGR